MGQVHKIRWRRSSCLSCPRNTRYIYSCKSSKWEKKRSMVFWERLSMRTCVCFAQLWIFPTIWKVKSLVSVKKSTWVVNNIVKKYSLLCKYFFFLVLGYSKNKFVFNIQNSLKKIFQANAMKNFLHGLEILYVYILNLYS